MSLNEEDDEDTLLLSHMMLQTEAAVIQALATKRNRSIDHCLLPREKKRRFRHKETCDAIQFDCLGPDALFGREFDLMFRMSRARFQRLMEDFAKSGTSFCSGRQEGLLP